MRCALRRWYSCLQGTVAATSTKTTLMSPYKALWNKQGRQTRACVCARKTRKLLQTSHRVINLQRAALESSCYAATQEGLTSNYRISTRSSVSGLLAMARSMGPSALFQLHMQTAHSERSSSFAEAAWRGQKRSPQFASLLSCAAALEDEHAAHVKALKP